ncbi:hypothetical protein VB738_00395 [Cyanobium gracile UHCC 0139]|uniref:DUF58 domain-containing protein n=1 Tax=Cyanobium gracile UHCC 0139 TaxID=3110308 RepID=A0ABU5RPK0_9CYAN|nr:MULTISPECIES: hypothetical protein [Synechococcales]MEA5389705.1 hypothetical protein [Cyanobium gracile UHCC 0139]
MPVLRPAGAKPRRLALVLLAGGGLVSFLALAATPHDGLHPLALMAALLPLQLAALAWAGMHRR